MRSLRNSVAGMFAVVAVVAAGWASGALWLTRTVGDDTRVEAVAARFVDSEQGRAFVANALGEAAAPLLGADAAAAAAAAAADDRVAAAATDALLRAYRALRDHSQGPVVVDSAPVVAALGDQIRLLRPGPDGDQAAAALEAAPPQVALPALPGGLAWAVSDGPAAVLRLSSLVAIAAAAAAAAVAADRSRILHRFGVFLLSTGAVSALCAIAVPKLLVGRGGVLAFAGALAAEATAGMVVVAAFELTIGGGLLLAAHATRRRLRPAASPTRDASGTRVRRHRGAHVVQTAPAPAGRADRLPGLHRTGPAADAAGVRPGVSVFDDPSELPPGSWARQHTDDLHRPVRRVRPPDPPPRR